MNWWHELDNRFDFLQLDDMVVMPNHVHGILGIRYPGNRTVGPDVGAIHESPLQGDEPAELPGSLLRRRMALARVVGYFKMNSAKEINRRRGTPGVPVWQRNYYERVIRDHQELKRIRGYIRANPLNWDTDKENPVNIKFRS